ncbi:MAG: ferredoxin reductase family protein [Acidimicrobiales bacterium]
MTSTASPDFRIFGIRGGLGRGAFVAAYAGLCLLPLLLGRIARDITGDFAAELGAGLGMAAYTMLLASFFLSGRFQTVSGRAGLDGILGMHRLLGFAATALIVGHIVVIQASGNGDAGPAAFIAVAALVLVVFLARARSKIGMRYEYWRLSHGIGALIVAGAGFAHATGDGYYGSTLTLKIYWSVLLALAVASLLTVHLVRPMGRMRQPYRIVDVELVADKTWKIGVEPTQGDALEFEPGQYAFLSLDRQPFMGSGHPFSFSSPPSQRPRVEFTVKENGDFTDTIGDLQPGTEVHLDGPHGYLSPARYRGPSVDHDGLVLIAGGVGIAPMMSILREGATTGRTKPALLLYAANSESDLAYRDELETLTDQLDLTVRYVLSHPPDGWEGDTGHIDDTYLQTHLTMADAGNRMYFVCGSTGMLDAVLDALDRVKTAPSDLIHAENFSVYD